MNFKSIALLGLSLATVGLSLPARADDVANVVNSDQRAIITGDGNDTSIKNKTSIYNRQSGRRSYDATGSSVTNAQTADIQGYENKTRLNNNTDVTNVRHNRR